MDASAKSTPTIASLNPTINPAPVTSKINDPLRPQPTKEAMAAEMPNRDFYLDTFFNPVWTSGPNVFSFNKNGTVVRPKKYEKEPYPGYSQDGILIRQSARASHSQGLSSREEKPWKNVAITEQDEVAMRARMWARANQVEDWENQLYNQYVNAQRVWQGQELPEYVLTWPPPQRH